MSKLLTHHADRIRALPHLADGAAPAEPFKLWEEGRLACHWAPFEHVNANAKLILVGITPGSTQMNRALNAAREALSRGADVDAAVSDVKRHGSFSGNMRLPLIKMLNKLGYQRQLGIASCSSLWGADYDKVHFCSLLRYPVFIGGKDYNGTPAPLVHPRLSAMLDEHFAEDLRALPADAVLIPLGETVLKTVVELRRRGLVPQKMVQLGDSFVAPPHPSGANAESITLLLQDEFPSLEEYCSSKRAAYMAKQGWLEKPDGKPMDEERYRCSRTTRWTAVRDVLLAHGMSV